MKKDERRRTTEEEIKEVKTNKELKEEKQDKGGKHEKTKYKWRQE